MLRVGASGWSHPEWVGPFYPVHLRDRPHLWLDRYAERFRTVEIASSFDAFPDEDLVEAWARDGARLQERAPFEYSLTLPRRITHEALAQGDLRSAREEAGRFDREVLDPLDGEGLLGAVLVRLPPTLEASEDAVTAVQEVLGALAERRVALELGHASWVAHGCVAPVAERLFLSRDVCVVEGDGPGSRGDVRPPIDPRHAYLRLQRGDDHLYTTEELRPWAARATHLDRQGREVRAYFRNAQGARSIANALDFRELCGAAGTTWRPRLTEQRKLPV